jgi:hypothetical protein
MIKRPMPRPSDVSLTILLILAVSLFFSPISAHSQAQSPATITFTLDFPASQPEHYSIRALSDGAGHYESRDRISADSGEADRFELEFTVGPDTRQKIFDLAARAGYFQKDIDSHHKGLAFTGKKTLAYKDAQRSGECTYNYSSNPAVQELTTLLEGLAATLEFGHRLQYDHRYQKLALDEELKRLEQMAAENQVVEVGAIRTILDEIIADASVMNLARARAQRLLQAAARR